MPSNAHVIILVHGIRDYALWQERIRGVLAEHFIVKSTNYGRFDLLRFLIPIAYFRDNAIESVWDQIRDVKKEYPKAKFSFVAHSFGTYILANILSREFDFKAFRVVFCGSVIKYNFPFEQLTERFTPPILNEVGTKDIWPALAESVTWGYGSAGTYGFHRPRIRDRWHTGARHGYFLDPVFCRKFWVPFFREGVIVDGASDPEDPPAWLQALSLFRLKYVTLLVLAAIAAMFAFVPQLREAVGGVFGSQVCYPYEPVNDAPDRSQPRRGCLPRRLSYVKWIDETAYSAVDRKTGRWPSDRANRILTINAVDVNGTPIWEEQNLLRVDAGRVYWQPPSPGGWTEIVGESADIVPGQTGALLRRQDPEQECSPGAKRKLLETFLPISLNDTTKRQDQEVEMCFRWADFDCSDKIPLRLGNNNSPFGICVGRVVRAIKD